MAIQTSRQFTLDWRDLGKGLLFALATALLPVIRTSFTEHHFDWWQIGQTSIDALVGYLAIKFVTPSKTVFPSAPPNQ